LQQIVWL